MGARSEFPFDWRTSQTSIILLGNVEHLSWPIFLITTGTAEHDRVSISKLWSTTMTTLLGPTI